MQLRQASRKFATPRLSLAFQHDNNRRRERSPFGQTCSYKRSTSAKGSELSCVERWHRRPNLSCSRSWVTTKVWSKSSQSSSADTNRKGGEDTHPTNPTTPLPSLGSMSAAPALAEQDLPTENAPATSSISTGRPRSYRKLINIFVAVLAALAGLALSATALWLSFRAWRISKWTARKDFYEVCSEGGVSRFYWA